MSSGFYALENVADMCNSPVQTELQSNPRENGDLPQPVLHNTELSSGHQVQLENSRRVNLDVVFPELFPPSPAAPPTHQQSGTSIFVTMASLCLSVTLSALDLTIVTTALPAIVSDFGSGSGYVWIGGAYILAYTAILLIWGTIANIWGRKPVMLIAVAIFFAGSLVCATVQQLDSFIVGRAIQGFGAAGMAVMVNVVISDLFSLRERGLYLAIVSIFYAAASAIGPVIGGLFTNRLKWVISNVSRYSFSFQG